MRVPCSTLAAGLMLAGCTVTPVDTFHRIPTVIPPNVLGTDVGADRFARAVPLFAGVDQAPSASAEADRNSGQAAAAGPAQADFSEQKHDISCDYAAQLAVEYSVINTQTNGSASIALVIDTYIIQDWRGSLRAPQPRAKVPVIKCWARVRWSIGAESDVDIWLLLDSEGDYRVRWDNIDNVVEE
jgi:hypothetical protein